MIDSFFQILLLNLRFSRATIVADGRFLFLVIYAPETRQFYNELTPVEQMIIRSCFIHYGIRMGFDPAGMSYPSTSGAQAPINEAEVSTLRSRLRPAESPKEFFRTIMKIRGLQQEVPLLEFIIVDAEEGSEGGQPNGQGKALGEPKREGRGRETRQRSASL